MTIPEPAARVSKAFEQLRTLERQLTEKRAEIEKLVKKARAEDIPWEVLEEATGEGRTKLRWYVNRSSPARLAKVAELGAERTQAARSARVTDGAIPATEVARALGISRAALYQRIATREYGEMEGYTWRDVDGRRRFYPPAAD